MRPGKLHKAAGNGFLLGSAPAERSDSLGRHSLPPEQQDFRVLPHRQRTAETQCRVPLRVCGTIHELALPVREQAEGEAPEHAITLVLDSTINNEEGYRLSVTEKSIRIEGRTEQGIFYGIQTLRKSLPAVAESKSILLPAAVVNDEPRFTYRAMHLDVCRHFFPVEFVKKYIDLLALHNMNTFHWHLTDDQGWRIESKKYPKLNEIGSVRHRTVVGYLGSGEYDNTDYGGYYTQEQMKEVVAYAAERYINVLPEIDLPGHTLSVLASYPEFGCTGGPYEVCPDWGVFPDVISLHRQRAGQVRGGYSGRADRDISLQVHPHRRR